MRKLFGTIMLVLLGIEVTFAQVNQINTRAETYMMRQITDQLIKELNDFPVNVRRMAVYKINYDANRFDMQSIAYIKGEIEATFRANAPVSIISPPELDPTDKLKIVGSDSTLQVMNIRGRSLADMSPELLEGVANKYSVSGLMELTVQSHNTEGLVVLIRVMNPQSREIVWAKSIAAFPIEERKKDEDGRRTVITIGTTSMENESFITTVDSAGIDVDSLGLVGTSSLNFSASFAYRQPLNEDFSSYLGIYVGLNIIKPTESSEFEASFWELGLTYDQALGPKSTEIDDYRLMVGADASVWFARGERQGNLITISPSIVFNLTENLGFEASGLIFVNERSIRTTDLPTNTYTYGQYGYGVKAYVRF